MDKLVLYIYKKNTSTVVPVCSMAFLLFLLKSLTCLAFFLFHIFFLFCKNL